MFLTSKLVPHFIDGFTSKFQNENPKQFHIYYLEVHMYILDLDLESEVHSIWDL